MRLPHGAWWHQDGLSGGPDSLAPGLLRLVNVALSGGEIGHRYEGSTAFRADAS
jgi:hypothetical protein